MDQFTGYQYLMIDCANQFDMDKELFEDRIQWVEENMDQLEDLAEEAPAKTRPLYLKAVQAIRKAQAGVPTGHQVGFDAVCSGMQIMSTLTGCESGAAATGLVDPSRRADAYTEVTDTMGTILGNALTVARKDAKDATMTVLYGSKKQPKNIFGDGTAELNAFYKAMYLVAPGACELLDDLLHSWNAFALFHEWFLPDGGHARVKVMEKVEKRLEVDELDHATFTYEYWENEGAEKGLSNVANVIHSIDAYVLRSLIRRCDYDRPLMEAASESIQMILMERAMGHNHSNFKEPLEEGTGRLVERYTATRMPDIRILTEITEYDLYCLTTDHLKSLARIVNSMLEHKPFPMVSVHDEFKCHANNMNFLRMHYRDIFAEMADSTILDDILSQLYKTPGTFPKKSPNLSAKIRKSNYFLS